MHAETKKNASRDTCSSRVAAPEATAAPAGAKNSSTWVLTTPACLTGRMASTWSSRGRAAAGGPGKFNAAAGGPGKFNAAAGGPGEFNAAAGGPGKFNAAGGIS